MTAKDVKRNPLYLVSVKGGRSILMISATCVFRFSISYLLRSSMFSIHDNPDLRKSQFNSIKSRNFEEGVKKLKCVCAGGGGGGRGRGCPPSSLFDIRKVLYGRTCACKRCTVTVKANYGCDHDQKSCMVLQSISMPAVSLVWSLRVGLTGL